ncbi:ROK family protein [Jiangella anatolica]|uniref:ROK family protein n=1 Tax=Jiangella anatolica TaxID=2670374 RepID=A0A2W2BNZ9_9ACTN|nr:ROK family protein [Jiangella anatolica]PZF81928.1 ROK family protein [Jiangella anatolica]
MPDLAPGLVLGIDFGGTKIDLATATAGGEIVDRVRIATEAADGAEAVVARAVRQARELMDVTQAWTGLRPVAAAAATPGIESDGGIALSPNIPGWDRLPLRDRLSTGLGLERLTVDTDVKLATRAEYELGALSGADPGLYLSAGTGVAAGIVVGGTVLRGANGAAGEIGYAPASSGSAGANLEDVVGGRAIEERVAAETGAVLRAGEVLLSDQPWLRALADGVLTQLGAAVAGLVLAVDPAVVAIGGGLMSASEPILRAVERAVAGTPFPPPIRPARFLHDGSLRGALLAAAGLVAPAAAR